MKSKVILFLCTIGVIFSCTKETKVKTSSPISSLNVLLLFKINDLDSTSAWDSYNEYLGDSTQSPHQPIIEWENGDVSKLNYEYLVFESSPDMAGSYFSFEGYEVFQRVFTYSQDSAATGIIKWNYNHSDTISITKYRAGGLSSIKSADFVTYNGDTIHNRSQIATDPKFLSFYQQPIFFVIIKTSKN